MEADFSWDDLSQRVAKSCSSSSTSKADAGHPESSSSNAIAIPRGRPKGSFGSRTLRAYLKTQKRRMAIVIKGPDFKMG